LDDGTRVGSISGGCLEEDVMARARRVQATGAAETVVYDTTSENDLVWGVGLGCHGVVKVLLERLPRNPDWARALADNFTARIPTRLAVEHGQAAGVPAGTRLLSDGAADFPTGSDVFVDTVPPPTALYIYGAGDDAQPLVRLAREMGWRVTVGDPRAAFATAERFPSADELIVAPAAQLVARTAPGADALAVVMTHHYVHDVPLLRDLLGRPLRYLGLLGPKKRATKILADLAADGLVLSAAQRAALHAPVGLDLGADAPEQVALAMIAEMQSVLGGRDAQPLNRRERPIHE